MNTLRKSFIIGLTVLGMGSASLAARADDTAGPGRYGHRLDAEQRQAHMAEHFSQRQAKLHDLLKLTPQQEAAWSAYQEAIKPAAPAAHPERAAFAALPAPERLAKMIDLSKQHTAAMESRLAALNTFYATLTPEQKQVFDANTLGSEHGRQHMKHQHS